MIRDRGPCWGYIVLRVLLLITLVAIMIYVLAVWFGGVAATYSYLDLPDAPVYVGSIFGHNAVGQSFRASYDGLCRIDVRLRPVRGDCRVTFDLQGEEVKGILSDGFVCSSSQAAWYSIRFPRVATSEGTDFRWRVYLTDPSDDTVVSLESTADDVRTETTLSINEQGTAVDAVFVPYYCSIRAGKQSVAKWLRYKSGLFLEWLDKDHNVFSVKELLVLVCVMASLLIVLLLLPSREQPLSLQKLLCPVVSDLQGWVHWRISLAFVVFACCVTGAVVLLGVQARLWAPAVARLSSVDESAIEIGESSIVAYDFISNLNASETVVDAPEDWYVVAGWLDLNSDHRPVLHMHPPSSVLYTVKIPPGAQLHAAAAIEPAVWSPDRGDGVLFIVRVVVDGVEETIYYQEIDPKNRPEDRRWHDFAVDLSPYAEQTISLVFMTYPLETNDWDQAVWGMPMITVP